MALTRRRQSACVCVVAKRASQAARDVDAGPTPRRRSVAQRVIEWFWRGAALREARHAFPELSEQAAELAQRAISSADAAASVIGHGDPPQPSSEPHASELYRQSAYWAVRALALGSEAESTWGSDAGEWDLLDAGLLARVAEDREQREWLHSTLRSGSFVSFVDLPASARSRACRQLRQIAESLLAQLDRRRRALRALQVQRAWRIALPVLLVLGCATGMLLRESARRRASDIALGKTWRISSQVAGLGCKSPAQECAESPNFFFHTSSQAEPWIEFDLGEPHQVSKLEIDNRKECCEQRAVPLAIEVSEDQRIWRAVATRDEVFRHWSAGFAPVRARWVRLRLRKTGILHLSRVRILP